MMKKNPAKQDSPPAAGCFSNIFLSAKVSKLTSTPLSLNLGRFAHFVRSCTECFLFDREVHRTFLSNKKSPRPKDEGLPFAIPPIDIPSYASPITEERPVGAYSEPFRRRNSEGIHLSSTRTGLPPSPARCDFQNLKPSSSSSFSFFIPPPHNGVN